MKTVLAIDGGGIKGVIPAFFLVTLARSVNRDLREVFDMVIGTSTGGIIALGVAAGINASRILDIYRTRGREIFEPDRWSFGGLLRPKYRAEGIDRILEEVFGDRYMKSSDVPIAVTAMRVSNNSSDVLSSWSDGDMLMRNAARATSAAPTFFPAAESGHWDGGCWGNNPAAVGFLEAEALWPGETVRVLSLGCGLRSNQDSVTDRMRGGLIRLAPLLPELLMGGGTDFMDRQMRRRGHSLYLRINGDLNGASPRLDDVSQKNIRELHYAADAVVDEYMQSAVDWLRRKPA